MMWSSVNENLASVLWMVEKICACPDWLSANLTESSEVQAWEGS
jgi:hypothetical protein